MKTKTIEQIKIDADVLASTEMKELVGGINEEMAISGLCGSCCAENNGGVSTGSQGKEIQQP